MGAVVLGAFLAVLLCFVLPERRLGAWLALAPAALFVWFGSRGAQMGLAESIAWVPELGLTLSFRLERLSWIFGLLITGIGALVFLYADAYVEASRRRFFGALTAFMAGMLGLVLADNLLLLFVFWEVTSVASFVLIGYDLGSQSARRAARQGLLITVGAGFFLLAGILWLGTANRTLELSQIRSGPTGAWILIMVGAFAKSAQFPLHFWLPNAMEAPTPVSAYLHSATMVQAGVYLLARTEPLWRGDPALSAGVMAVGLCTVMVGAITAIFQRDLKKLLAYSTVSALGCLTVLVGSGQTEGFEIFLIAHAMFKAALFFVAGSVSHLAHTKDAYALRGLARSAPGLALAGLLAAASMAGLPPTWGFAGKEMLLHSATPWAIAAIVTYGMGAATVAYAVGVRPFLGVGDLATHPVGSALILPPILLAALGCVAPFAAAVPALGVPLALSVLALLGGIGLALFWERRGYLGFAGPSWDQLYDSSLKVGGGVGRAISGRVQSGHLHGYLRAIIGSTIALILVAAAQVRIPNLNRLFGPLTIEDIALGTAIMAAAISGVLSRSRLGAVAVVGVVGTAIAIIYAMYGAPDLAMTQVAVETLTLLLFVFAFAQLPKVVRRPKRRARLGDAMIATTVGLVMMGVTLFSGTYPTPPAVANFYLDHALSEGFGRNVVNVILVDFRGLDTLGEVTVMAIAALGVYVLLRIKLSSAPSAGGSQ